jgi:hypothetical protein
MYTIECARVCEQKLLYLTDFYFVFMQISNVQLDSYVIIYMLSQFRLKFFGFNFKLQTLKMNVLTLFVIKKIDFFRIKFRDLKIFIFLSLAGCRLTVFHL